ncbi:hypothetical protein M422DRAFT_273144 [Sphaerobolus stellatus SS14]|uniref:Uncharacterized protein n=1 Tax=Sphaerobolus stellatus (strain SS14) TaxID=990650 RepID=A0A0C9U9W2_SPHS4|nr:hypothetical protein M422DRAFT_273144 [Sphaerobolus stellatus SS14]
MARSFLDIEDIRSLSITNQVLWGCLLPTIFKELALQEFRVVFQQDIDSILAHLKSERADSYPTLQPKDIKRDPHVTLGNCIFFVSPPARENLKDVVIRQLTDLWRTTYGELSL